MTHLNRTLTQTVTSGATAMAILAGLSMAATPQAEAAQLTCTQLSPCMLSDFVGTDNFLVIGDKKFSNFEYTDRQGNTPNANNIKMYQEIINGVYNIAFNGLFIAPRNRTTKATLSHTVEILKPNAYFKDVILSGNTQGPFAEIKETVFDLTSSAEVAQLKINSSNVPATLLDQEDISALKLKSLKVKNEFDLVGNGGTSSFSVFRQAYTQVDIPEPASVLGLLAVGSLGTALTRKREN